MPAVETPNRRAGIVFFRFINMVTLVVLIATLFVSGEQTNKVAGNEKAAIAVLKIVRWAQGHYFKNDLDEDGISNYASSMEELHAAGLIPEEVVGGGSKGYQFTIQKIGEYTFEDGWAGVANPMEPGKSGNRYFYVDVTGVIRVSETGEADRKSPKRNLLAR